MLFNDVTDKPSKPLGRPPKPPQNKVCTRCKATQPMTGQHWQRDKTTSDGFHAHCKTCRHAYDRQRDAQRNRQPMRKLLTRVAGINQRARQAGANGILTRSDVLKLWWRSHQHCYWCQKPITGGWHVEHIQPFYLGGDNTPVNVCVSCPSCNAVKAGHTVQWWLYRLSARGVMHDDTPADALIQLPLFEAMAACKAA